MADKIVKKYGYVFNVDGKEQRASEDKFNDYGGIEAYKEDFPDATVKMLNKEGKQYDMPLKRYDDAVKAGFSLYKWEKADTIHEPDKDDWEQYLSADSLDIAGNKMSKDVTDSVKVPGAPVVSEDAIKAEADEPLKAQNIEAVEVPEEEDVVYGAEVDEIKESYNLKEQFNQPKEEPKMTSAEMSAAVARMKRDADRFAHRSGMVADAVKGLGVEDSFRGNDIYVGKRWNELRGEFEDVYLNRAGDEVGEFELDREKAENANAVKSATQRTVQRIFAEEQAKAKENADKASQYDRMGGFVPAGSSMARGLFATTQKMQETDPEKVMGNVVSNLLNDEALLKGAMRPYLQEGKSIEEAVNFAANDLATTAQNEMIAIYKDQIKPNSNFDYMLGEAWKNSLVNQLGSGIARVFAGTSGLGEQLKDEVYAEAGEKAGTMYRVGAGVGSLLLDAPVFGGIGSASGTVVSKGTQALANLGAKKAIGASGKAGVEAASRYLSGAVASRMAQGAVSTGMTLGTYDGLSEWLRGLRTAGETDVLGRAKHGFTTGALIGWITPASRYLSKNMSKAGKLMMDGGAFVTEAELFNLSGLASEGVIDLSKHNEGFLESAATLLIMKGSHKAPKVFTKEGRAELVARYNSPDYANQARFTRDELNELKELGYDLKDIFTSKRQEGKQKATEVVEGVENADAEVLDRTTKEAKGDVDIFETYERMQGDENVPMNIKAKMAYFVESKITVNAPKATRVDYREDADGIVVETYDGLSRLVSRKRFAKNERKDAKSLVKELELSCEANSVDIMEQLYDRNQMEYSVGSVIQDLWEAEGGNKTKAEFEREVIESRASKDDAGRALWNMVETLAKKTASKAERLREAVERKNGVKIADILSKPVNKRSLQEVATLAEYERSLREVPILEADFTRPEAEAKADVPVDGENGEKGEKVATKAVEADGGEIESRRGEEVSIEDVIAFYNLSQGDAKIARKIAGDFAGEIAELEAERQMAIAWSNGEPASEKPLGWEYWKEREGLSEPVEGLNGLNGEKADGANEADDIKEPSVREEFLANGDKRIINYNSRGEVSTVATERDGKIHSVDSYDDGALFETTTYDENGRSTSVTRYDKNGDVLKVYKFDDSDAAEGEKNGVPSVQEQVEIAESDVNTTPTDKQKEAGNYKKGHVKIGKFNITIEQPKGSVRSGVDANGNKWETEMQNTYGYIRGTESVDGDHIDVFLSDDIDNWDGREVYVVDQRKEDGSFDEHKVMLGFNNINDAEAAYMSNYKEGWQGLGAITGVSVENFEKWINQSHRKTKAFAEYKINKGEAEKVFGVEDVVKRVEEWSEKLGGNGIRVVTRIEDVDNARALEVLKEGKRVDGWYDVANDQVVIYAPNVKSAEDVDKTYVHEVVAHKGVRGFLGKHADEFFERVWKDVMSDAERSYFEKYEGVGDIKDERKRRVAAADEYVAHFAEKDPSKFTAEEKTAWKKIVDYFYELINKILSGAKFTHKDIEDVLRMGAAHMRAKKEGRVEGDRADVANKDRKVFKGKKRGASQKVDAKKEIGKRVAEEWSDAPSDIKDELLRLSETSEPLDVEDVVYEYLEGLRSPKTRNKLLLQGDGVLKGVTDELGLPAKELQKALGMNAFATRANGGISLQKMAERIAEDMDSNIVGSSDVDSTDIRDILIDAISSASEPADISYHRARKRVKMAEKLYSDWKRNEEALEAEYARDADAYNAYVENELIELEKVAKMLPEGGITAIFADEYIREQQIREQYERTTERSDRGSEILQGKRVDTSRGVESSPDGRTVSEKIGGRVLEGANADAQGGQVAGATKREVRAEEGIVAERGKGEKGKKGVKAGENRLPDVEAAMRESELKRVAAKLEGLDRRLAEIRRELSEDREGESIQAQADAMVELYGGYANAPAEVRARIDNQVARLSERRRELIEEEKRIEAEIKKTVSDLAKGKTGKADAGGTRFSVYGGNSGYEGYSMSKRAREAREEGRYPKTDFKKEYGLNERELTALVDAGIVSDKEWHHTSKYGNKTVFYGFANRGATDYYNANKERVKQAIKDGTIGDLLPEFADASDAYDVKESDRINKELEDYRRDVEKREEYYEYLKTVIPSEYTASNGVVVDSKGSNLQFMWSATRNGKKPKNKNAVYKAFEEFAEFLRDKVPSFEEWSKEGVRFSVKDEDKKGINVPKEEYAKIAHQIASYPNKAERGHVFTDKNYYLCDGIDAEGNFTILAKLPIVGNEDLINKLRGENGRRNFKAIENSEDITATIEEIKRRRRRPNRNISSLKRQSRIDGRDDSVYLGEHPNFDRNQQTAKSDDKEGLRFRVDDEDVAVKALLGNQHIFDGMRKLEEGETSYVERTFSENKNFEFNSKNFIKGYDDVAYIFKQLENESVENAFAVLVKNGRPTVVHLGMGGFTQTMVNQSGLNVAVNRVKPDKIYFVHNHPSGVLKSSLQDRSILNELILAYGSDVVQYGVIINTFTGKYGIFSSDIEGMSYDMPNEQEGDRPIKVYSFNKQVYDKNYQPTISMRNSEDVAAFITSQRLGDRQKIGLLVVDNQLRITGNIFLPYSEFTRENADKIANDIAYYTAVMGGNRAFLFGNASLGDLEGKNISERVKSFSGGQIQMLDYVEINGGRHKSAYDEGVRFRVANESQEVFVSNATRAVEQIKQEKATPEQWLKMIEKQGGLKVGEDKWIGLSDWLKASDRKSLTKQEVLDFIKDNKIQIEEVKYSQYGEGLIDEATKKLEKEYKEIGWVAMQEKYPELDEYFELYNGEILWSENRASVGEYEDYIFDVGILNVATTDEAINETRERYTTEGLERKREIALTVPTIEPWNVHDEVHFGDAGNGRAIAWIRFGETTDTENNRVLVIDEIQSKRHQEGREKGYISKARKLEVAEVEEKLRVATKVFNEYRDQLKEKYDYENLGGSKLERIRLFKEAMTESEFTRFNTLANERANAERLLRSIRSGHITMEDVTFREYDGLIEGRYDDFVSRYVAGTPRGAILADLNNQIRERNINDARKLVPDAPFEKNWSELAMKRMLRLAADEGFDKVAWTTGEQQAERYDIGTKVSHIHVIPSAEDRYVSISPIGGRIIETPTEPDSDIIVSGEFKGKSLAEVYGKALADKIMSVEVGSDERISGDGLRIGAEGMKGFYDKMLPNFVNKYVKKWGAKVSEVELPEVEESGRKMWSIDVTPEMKRDVKEGQVMFSVREDGEYVAPWDDAFNAEIENIGNKSYITIGKANDLLRSLGMPKYADIYVSRVNLNKAEEKGIALQDLKNLPSELSEPLAVFGGYADERSVAVLTNLKTGSSGTRYVWVTLVPGVSSIEAKINVVNRPVEGRKGIAYNSKIVDWINEGKMLCVDKEKMASYMADYNSKYKNEDLISATEIVDKFDNPKVVIEIEKKKVVKEPEASKKVTFGEYTAPYYEGESYSEAMDRLSRKKNVLNVEVQRMERRRAMGGDIDEAELASKHAELEQTKRDILYMEAGPKKPQRGHSKEVENIMHNFGDKVTESQKKVIPNILNGIYERAENRKDGRYADYLKKTNKTDVSDAEWYERNKILRSSTNAVANKFITNKNNGLQQSDVIEYAIDNDAEIILTGDNLNALIRFDNGDIYPIDKYGVEYALYLKPEIWQNDMSAEDAKILGAILRGDKKTYVPQRLREYVENKEYGEGDILEVVKEIRDLYSNIFELTEDESEWDASYAQKMEDWRRAVADWKSKKWGEDSMLDAMLREAGGDKSYMSDEEFQKELEAENEKENLSVKEMKSLIKNEIRERRRNIEVGNWQDEMTIHDIKGKTTEEQRKLIPHILEGTFERPENRKDSRYRDYLKATDKKDVSAAEWSEREELLRNDRDAVDNKAITKNQHGLRQSDVVEYAIDNGAEIMITGDNLNALIRFDNGDIYTLDKYGVQYALWLKPEVWQNVMSATDAELLGMFLRKEAELYVPQGLREYVEKKEYDNGNTLEVVNEIRDWYSEMWTILEREGMTYKKEAIEDYVTHIWDLKASSPTAITTMQKFMAATAPKALKDVNNYIATNTPYIKERAIGSIRDGEAIGLVPKYEDITDIMRDYGHRMNEAIENRRLVNFVKGLRVNGMDAIREAGGKNDGVYVLIKNNALRGYEVHRDVKPVLDIVFGDIHTTDNEWLQKIGHVYDAWGGLLKKINLSLSFFHHGALTETAIAMTGPLYAGKTIFKNVLWDAALKGHLPAFNDVELTKDAVSHFVQLGATSDYSTKEVQALTTKFAEWAEGKVGAEELATILDFWNKGLDTFLWDYLHDGLKVYGYAKMAKEIRAKAAKAGWSEETLNKALDEAGQLINDTYGGQHWDLLGVSPNALKWARRAFLSPDWTLSTLRQALAPFGIGQIYNDKTFWKKWFKDDDVASVRKRYGRAFWVTAALFFGSITNLLNAYFRLKDEEEEKAKAEEIRKTDPDYLSPYELAYPDGMKWWEYTMLGNTVGHATHVFGGRYEDGTEQYVRWGKQFRELPELFFGRDGLSFPQPMIDKIAGKLNPMINLMSNMSSGYSLSGFENDYMKNTRGWDREFARLQVLVAAHMPYSIPTDEEKEFKALDLIMPSTKGFSNWKAIDRFKTAIKGGDMDFALEVYNACVKNGLKADELVDVAIKQIEVELKREMIEGVADVNDAVMQFDTEENPVRKKQLENYIKKQLSAQDYKEISKEEFSEKVFGAIKGGLSEEQSTAYDKKKNSEDLIEDWRITKGKSGLKKYVDEAKSIEQESADPEQYAKYMLEHGDKVRKYNQLLAVQRELTGLKKLLGTGRDADVMAKIREIRKKAFTTTGKEDKRKKKTKTKKREKNIEDYGKNLNW